jgi:Holliday junction DNA helicase RuvB
LKELKIKNVNKTIAASLREDKESIEDVYEPFLLQEGLLERTPRGRQATRRAYQHLDINVPQGLF